MWRMTLDIPLAILASLAMYLAPGYALARLLWRGRALSAPEMFGVALGAGIALPPLLLEHLGKTLASVFRQTGTAWMLVAAMNTTNVICQKISQIVLLDNLA